jgi:hypothetical protein
VVCVLSAHHSLLSHTLELNAKDPLKDYEAALSDLLHPLNENTVAALF